MGVYSQCNQAWIQQSYQRNGTRQYNDSDHDDDMLQIPSSIHNPRVIDKQTGQPTEDLVPTNSMGPYAPLWQVSPPPLPQSIDGINANPLAVPLFEDLVQAVHQSGSVAVSAAREIHMLN
jgi:hypothetical protein